MVVELEKCSPRTFGFCCCCKQLHKRSFPEHQHPRPQKSTMAKQAGAKKTTTKKVAKKAGGAKKGAKKAAKKSSKKAKH